MGSRSIGELLLRPTALSRVPLSQTSSKPRLIAPLWSSRRALTNSTRSHSAQPQPREKPVDEPLRQAPADQAANPFADFLPKTNAHGRSPPLSEPESVTQGIDNLFASMNSSNFRRAVPQATRSPTSSDEFSAAHTQHLFGADWSPSTGGMQRRKPLDLNEMAMPDDGLTDILGPVAPVPEMPESEKNYPRLNPSYGRKVELDPSRGRDLVRGINMLGSLMARNKVRADFMKQRHHERPGLKRKRLKSERWRARFKAGFQSVTARVTELTKKGW